jgi:hypothetical protein
VISSGWLNTVLKVLEEILSELNVFNSC